MPATETEPASWGRRLRSTRIPDVLPPTVLVLVFGSLFYSLLSSHMVQKRPDGWYSGGSTWGDLAWHLSMISNFVERGWGAVRDNPVFSGDWLSYPFLPDLFSAWLVQSGVSLQASLIWPTLIAILTTILELYFFARTVIQSRYEAMLAPFLFLCNGSIVGCYYLWRDFRASHLPFPAFLANPPLDYAHPSQENIQFSNLIADHVLPQRALIFGLALGLVMVRKLWTYWKGAHGSRPLFQAGIVLSLLPLVHFHSFVALGMAAAFLAMIDLGEPDQDWKSKVRAWAWFAAPVALIGLPQVFWILPPHSRSFMRFQFGWMSGREFGLWFWLRNLSPHLFVFAVAACLVPERFRSFWAAFAGIFVVSNIVIFQPYDFDNMKLMLWPFLVSCVGAASLFALLRRRWGWKATALCLLVAGSMMLTGVSSIYREVHLHWQMFSNEDLELAAYVKAHSEKDAIFLTSDKHNHPIPCLAGRRILMGYRGWLWSHGIDYRSRESDVFEIYEGSPRLAELLKQYDVSYLLLEWDKLAAFHENPAALLGRFPVVYQSRNYILFKVR